MPRLGGRREEEGGFWNPPRTATYSGQSSVTQSGGQVLLLAERHLQGYRLHNVPHLRDMHVQVLSRLCHPLKI